MADVEQEQSNSAETERQKAPCQVLQPARYSGVEQATSTPFIIKAYVDGHALTAALETAKDAFAKAIEWYIVGKFADVSISDGTRSYSIVEFSFVMALAEIAQTIRSDVEATKK
jgi:hypothetical protein